MPEYVLKAGFLYNFAKYVEWPADAFENKESPISVGVVGKDPFGNLLEKTLKDRQAQDRRFSIVRYAGPAELKPCHILFIPKTEKARAAEVGKILNKKLINECLTLAREITKNSSVAVRASKMLINRGMDADIETGLRLEIYGWALCFAHEDRKNMMSAFLNKGKK